MHIFLHVIRYIITRGQYLPPGIVDACIYVCVSFMTTLTLSQWSSSGLPVAIQCAWNLDPSVHWNATGERIVGSQCVSSGFPVVFRCVPIMQNNTGSPLGYHWVLASASVVPVASQCTCGSSGLPVYSNYANEHWIATGTPLGASFSQCGSSGIPVYLWLQWSSSVVCPVVSQCTDIIWFGGH